MRVDENLCRLAIKSAIVTGQKYGTFKAKVRHFWQQSMVVLGITDRSFLGNRSIAQNRTDRSFLKNRSIIFSKTIDRLFEKMRENGSFFRV